MVFRILSRAWMEEVNLFAVAIFGDELYTKWLSVRERIVRKKNSFQKKVITSRNGQL